MILYDPAITITLLPYGIQIPVRDSRAQKTLAALRSHPQLGPFQNRWHQTLVQEILTKEDLLRVHSPEYIKKLYSEQLEQEIVSTYELIGPDGRYNRYAPETAVRPLHDLFGRILFKAAGTVQCTRLALEHGFCFYFAGGMHHAHFDHGSGFCLINDILIAIRKLQAEKKIQRVWVIDVDAHKGDGTAALTAGDDTIRTLSIHMANGWPLDGPAILRNGVRNPVFIPSDIDIPIAVGEDDLYLPRLAQGLEQLAQSEIPDLALVVSGADPYEKDELPSTAGLRLSLDQMMGRDRMIYEYLRARHIPAAYVMAGGYGDEVWQVFAQFLTWALQQCGCAR